MNNLSWLLYWADTLPQVAAWLCVVSFLLFLVCGFLFVLGLTQFGGDREMNNDEGREAARVLRNWGLLWIPFFILWGASFLVPSKETFYLIAASQAGEKALATPEFGKVRGVINKWLDDSSSNSNQLTK